MTPHRSTGKVNIGKPPRLPNHLIISGDVQGLDMSAYLHPKATHAGDTLYDCFAFSCHMGTFSGGHYTAYARNPVAPGSERSAEHSVDPRHHKWFLFNDGEVRHVANPADMDTRAGYLLFFRRRAAALQDPQDLLTTCRCVPVPSGTWFSFFCVALVPTPCKTRRACSPVRCAAPAGLSHHGQAWCRKVSHTHGS